MSEYAVRYATDHQVNGVAFVDEITSLKLSSPEVTSMGGLVELKDICLSNMQDSDLAPLSGLIELKWLSDRESRCVTPSQ